MSAKKELPLLRLLIVEDNIDIALRTWGNHKTAARGVWQY